MKKSIFPVNFTRILCILAARIVNMLSKGYYGTISDAVTTFTLVIMLVISMFLFRQSLQSMQTQLIENRMEAYDIPNDSHPDTQPRWAHHS